MIGIVRTVNANRKAIEMSKLIDADKVIEEIKPLIEFEFNWLRAVKDEEGYISLGALDIAERAMKSKVINIVKKGGAE